MSSAAEADKNSAAEAAEGLEDEAVMAAIVLLLSMYVDHYAMFIMVDTSMR